MSIVWKAMATMPLTPAAFVSLGADESCFRRLGSQGNGGRQGSRFFVPCRLTSAIDNVTSALWTEVCIWNQGRERRLNHTFVVHHEGGLKKRSVSEVWAWISGRCTAKIKALRFSEQTRLSPHRGALRCRVYHAYMHFRKRIWVGGPHASICAAI